MDKNAIKKYAVWARRELISRVSQRAALYEITDKDYGDASADSVLGRVMSAEEKHQRQALIAQIREKGYEQVMEEIAYTWFNRFIALRFMEVNGYLPSRVRVFTDDENNFKPQILTEAINMELDGLDMEKVYALKNANDDDALFKYMLIVQCNALSSILPGMFQRISDYTELLLPDNLLREGSVIEQMISMIPEEDWKDAVQIIGWLYQYYNSEKKDDVFAALKKNVKITKENIPAATQLFTPDWIVRYMVENSLGRLWLEGHPDVKEQLLPTEEEQSAYAAGNRDPEDTKWHYYLEEAEQEPDVQEQLAEIRKEYAALTPDQLKVIDPCSGSGHILVYMFDVLMQIYESYGYTTREAVASIVENNLYGLDIDDRAAQLAYFAVMMKARQYDRRFFSRGIQPHVYAIAESNHVDSFALEYFCNGDAKLKKAMDTIISELHDAKEYGSILTVTQQDWSALYARFAEIEEDIYISREAALSGLLPLVQTAQALAQKYDTVVTNPPYMAVSNADAKVNDYVKKNFPDSKADLFAVFIERCGQMAKKNGYQAMITQHSWMFLSSFEKLRTKLLVVDIVNMAHLGARAFEEIGGEVVQTTAFVIRKSHIADYKGEYCRLIEPTSQQGKENMFLDGENRYNTDQSNFPKIPGSPVAYWVSAGLLSAFATGKSLGDIALARNGMKTGENGRFVRLWWEVILQGFNSTACDWKEASSSGAKWFPYNKGGEFRKWYGNNDCIVNWQNEGDEIFNHAKADKRNVQDYPLELKFKPSASWSLVTSGQPAFRYKENNLSDIAGMSFFTEKQELLILLGFCNSKIALEILKILAPTINFQAGDIGRLPIVDYGVETDTIRALVTSNIDESALDWDSFETSWDFRHHPLLRKVPTIAEAFDQWQAECDDRFNQLKANEEELNRIFIDIYGLQNELTPEVEDKDVTVRRADLGRDIRSFISYAVGCMFGRYSLDVDGLAYAGGEWDASKYASFAADKDNIIPICDDEYFDDDIVGRFVEFVRKVYGDDTLEENLKFVADALGGKGQPKDVIRNYFLSDFYSDHCKIYQKRPIYWLFDSGKKNGFKALIYMHRYKPDIIARMRTDYVHEQQGRYRTAIADLESRIANADTGSRVKLTKQLTKLQNQAEELRVYEEKIHHLADQMIRIDLDDGVKHNYAIFQDVLAKIK
ncbi:MAG: BREX-1 system adenine-specific DNA-methyltransferase PglX [Oscillospiraceae bacterium]|nr:BREX-1 system adenine-specific DNA-methyltransferase PglX [Oscillospiraceae bacterium]